jgi:opacity protein-like surface antigen
MAPRIVFVAALLLLAAPLAIPARAESGVDWLWGGGFHLGVPTGEFKGAADEGYGLAGHFAALPHGLPVGVRGEVSALVYGSRSFDRPANPSPYPGGYGGGSVHTDTWFGNMLLGPELRARGGAVRPYVHALAGLGYFATSSEQYHQSAPGHDRTRFDDTTFAWAVGGGLELALGSSTSIDVGARYLANGTVDYYTEQGIASGDGALLSPRRSPVHVVTFTLGVAFGR